MATPSYRMAVLAPALVIIAINLAGCTAEEHYTALDIRPVDNMTPHVEFTPDEFNVSEKMRFLRSALEQAAVGEPGVPVEDEQVGEILDAIDDKWEAKYGTRQSAERIVRYDGVNYRVLVISS